MRALVPILLTVGLVTNACRNAPAAQAGDPVLALLAPTASPAELQAALAGLQPIGKSEIDDHERPYLRQMAKAREAEERGDLPGALDLYAKAEKLPHWEAPSGEPRWDLARVRRKMFVEYGPAPADGESCDLITWSRESATMLLAIGDDLLGYVVYVEAEYSSPEWGHSPENAKKDLARRDAALQALKLVLDEYGRLPRHDFDTNPAEKQWTVFAG